MSDSPSNVQKLAGDWARQKRNAPRKIQSVYIEEPVAELLEDFSRITGLSKTMLASALLAAAVRDAAEILKTQGGPL